MTPLRINLNEHPTHKILQKKNLLHSLGLVYKSMRGMVTNSTDRDQWLNVTSESRDRIWPFFFLLFDFIT
jgi:hypothetical protein